MAPQLLQFTPSDAIPAEAQAVAVVFALSAIESHKSLLEALQGLPGQDESVQATVTKVYNARVPGGDRAQPDENAVQAAHDALYGMHLTKRMRIFGG